MKKILNKRTLVCIIGILLLALAIVGLWFLYDSSVDTSVSPSQKPVSESVPIANEGDTTEDECIAVTINVKDSDGNLVQYLVKTKGTVLEDAMKDAEGLTYETANGMVMKINGIRADYVLDGAYWAFYIGSDYCNFGISDQPIADSDIFTIEYTKA